MASRLNCSASLQLWFSQKSNLHCTRITTSKRVTSDKLHLRDLAHGQHSSEETSQRLRAVGDTVSDLTGPRTERKTSGAYNNVFTRDAHWSTTLVGLNVKMIFLTKSRGKTFQQNRLNLSLLHSDALKALEFEINLQISALVIPIDNQNFNGLFFVHRMLPLHR